MNYALIEDEVVVNIIWLYEGNANEFPNAVAIDTRPVGIGDVYSEGDFYREGVKVLSALEQSEQYAQSVENAYIESVYNASLLEFGLE